MNNFLWYDCETTGLKEYKHDIIQLAAIPTINGIRQKPFNEYCQPTNWEDIEQAALDVHGVTIEQMKTFQTQEQMIEKFIIYLLSFGCQFTTAGFNVMFDKKFLSATFMKHSKNEMFFNLFNSDVHDTYARAKIIGKKELKTDNLKLATLAKHFNINIIAHDAISDIEATIDVDEEIAVILGESSNIYIPGDTSLIETEDMPEPAQLHIHSQYSMLEGILSVEEWIDWCLENGSPGLSITDHGIGISLYKTSKIKEYIAKYNIKNKTEFPEDSVTSIPGLGLNFKVRDEDEKYYTINAWATSNKGYFNLVKLSSIGFANAIDKNKQTIPIVKMSDIISLKEGLLFGTAGADGYIGEAIESGNPTIAEARFCELNEKFKDSLYVEFSPTDITHRFEKKIGFKKVTENALVDDGNLQKAYNKYLSSLVDKYKSTYNIKPIPTTAASFIKKEDKVIQDCMKKNGHKDGSYTHESYHQRSSTQMYKELKIHLGDWLTPDVYKEWVSNSYEVADSAKGIDIKFDFHLPKIEIPKHIQKMTDNYDKQTTFFLMERIKFHGRWNKDPIYIERFKKELDVILKNEAMNFLPYFLTYEDLGVYARNAGFLQNIARGSAGGSLLSYYLKIIHVDPVKKDLPFERFLSHARIRAGSWPDIDMDISKTARPILIKYLQKKYGKGFAQVSTLSTMKTKNAIKDAVWAIYNKNRNDFEIDAICKTIPDSPQGIPERDFLYGYTDREGEKHDGEIDKNETLRRYFEQHPEIKSMVDRMIGIVRGWSRHASAFVISTVDLSKERVPTMLMHDKTIGKAITVTQYPAEMVEGVGLVKADILGLKTLSAVTDATNLILKEVGVDYLEEDENGLALLYRLPEDEDIYADFYNKKTDSSFQFNTPVVKGSIQDFAPTERKHNMDLTALLRPGAMDAKMTGIKGCEHLSATEYYIEVRKGDRSVEYIHKDLEYILKETNGAFTYQEQIMQFLVEVVGYSLEESDIIRSAIAKKKHSVMMASFDRIKEATGKRGWNQVQQDAICNAVMAFSRYSFNKSHSYAYAELGYITMYLKHHHPTEWWTAVLNNEDNEDKLRSYISLLGDKIKPPSMKNPAADFKSVDGFIVAPVSVIKSVGPKAVAELCAKGPFLDLQDYVTRVNHTKVNIGAVGQMIKARAADVFMDMSSGSYAIARTNFMSEYKRVRGNISSNFKPELRDVDPLSIFLMEKETNKAFNKSVLMDSDNVQHISANNDMQMTHNKGAPLYYRKQLVLSSERIAKGMVEQGYEGDVCMVLLFNGSGVKSGISKKGRPYVFTKIQLTDGLTDIEATFWDNDKPLRFLKNSFVIVVGTITEGWGTDVGITVKEIRQIR